MLLDSAKVKKKHISIRSTNFITVAKQVCFAKHSSWNSIPYLESSTPAISKIISSNMVHDNEKVVEKINCTSL